MATDSRTALLQTRMLAAAREQQQDGRDRELDPYWTSNGYNIGMEVILAADLAEKVIQEAPLGGPLEQYSLKLMDRLAEAKEDLVRNREGYGSATLGELVNQTRALCAELGGDLEQLERAQDARKAKRLVGDALAKLRRGQWEAARTALFKAQAFDVAHPALTEAWAALEQSYPPLEIYLDQAEIVSLSQQRLPTAEDNDPVTLLLAWPTSEPTDTEVSCSTVATRMQRAMARLVCTAFEMGVRYQSDVLEFGWYPPRGGDGDAVRYVLHQVAAAVRRPSAVEGAPDYAELWKQAISGCHGTVLDCDNDRVGADSLAFLASELEAAMAAR